VNLQMGGAKMERFHEDLAMALGKALKSQDVIAKKENGQDAIWSAWNEETNMKLWGKKLKLLQELEEGLGKAAKKQGYDAQLKVLKSTLGKLAKVKKGLIELNGKTVWLQLYRTGSDSLIAINCTWYCGRGAQQIPAGHGLCDFRRCRTARTSAGPGFKAFGWVWARRGGRGKSAEFNG
jgi:hypothetical protein